MVGQMMLLFSHDTVSPFPTQETTLRIRLLCTIAICQCLPDLLTAFTYQYIGMHSRYEWMNYEACPGTILGNINNELLSTTYQRVLHLHNLRIQYIGSGWRPTLQYSTVLQIFDVPTSLWKVLHSIKIDMVHTTINFKNTHTHTHI